MVDHSFFLESFSHLGSCHHTPQHSSQLTGHSSSATFAGSFFSSRLLMQRTPRALLSTLSSSPSTLALQVISFIFFKYHLYENDGLTYILSPNFPSELQVLTPTMHLTICIGCLIGISKLSCINLTHDPHLTILFFPSIMLVNETITYQDVYKAKPKASSLVAVFP